MKKILCIVFLTFTLVLSHQDVTKRGGAGSKEKLQVTPQSTNQALANLMTAGKPIIDTDGSRIVSPYCNNVDMKPRCKLDTDGGFFCNFEHTTCYATGAVATNEVKVYSKTHEELSVPTGSDQCANRPEFQAIFLPFVEKRDSYTFLNPSVAPWFFTDPLGGCDMFVATETNHGDKPLVIHSNRNDIDNAVDNLRAKEQFVDRLLSRLQRTYKVIARVYWTSRKEEEKKAIDQHLDQYVQSHPEVKRLISYNEVSPSGKQPYHFIGHYRSDLTLWRFISKGEKNGDTAEFRVSQQGKVV